ncbi:MAG: glycosyltransferase [Rudaea sp.]|nr:glycosyltransferase [Rudaea sp.]
MASDDRDTMKTAPVLVQTDTRAANSTASGNAAGNVTPTSASPARPILVLGMHRSGTSALASLLGAMGAHVGESDELLPAHAHDNPSGYWERTELVIEHDRFLAATGHAWDRVAGFDSHDHDDEASRRLQSSLRRLVGRLNARTGPWLVKDPRLCLLLPQWLPLLDDAALVIAVRDPREIAASLLAGHRGVYTSHFILALWEKYLLTLLADLRGRRALFVSYEAMLADPRGQSERLLRGLHALGADGLHALDSAELDALLDRRLRRSEARPHMLLSPGQAALVDWLETQARLDSPTAVAGFPAHAAPDVVLAEFEHALDDKAERSRVRALGEAAERLGRIEAALDAQTRERAGWLAELATQREQAQQARTETTQLAANLAATQRQRDELERGVAQIGSEKAQLDVQATALAEHVRALRSSWSWKLTAPLRGVGGLFRRSGSFAIEQKLHHGFYALPGMNAARKRALVLWLHRHAPWLTRHTFSYQLYARSRQAETSPSGATGPRMDAARAQTIIAAMPTPPLISIVMPVYNVERRWLMAAVDSVRRQFYPHWELCIADDASTLAETRATLDELASVDTRIRIVRLPANAGIAGASNAALKLASGDYVGLLDNDDALTRDALLEVARNILADDPDIVYSDEDKIDVDGRHVDAHFKPDFNPDYFLSINYLCHFTVLRRALLERIGGFRTSYDGAQDYDLFLRATERGERVCHIPKVLYHWRMTPGSTATASSAKPLSWDAGRRALAESLARRGIDASAEAGPYPNTYRVRRTIAGQPLVSILLPFRDKPELLSTCLLSLLEKTDYPHFEVVGIDNGSAEPSTHALIQDLERRDSRIRFVRYGQPFNYSAVNNFGAEHAHGEHLLLLNNDTEIVSAEWLRAMLEHSQRPEVGVVGARLLYPDDRIQHAGVIVGIGGVAGHAHLLQPAQEPGYFSRAQLPQNLSAVTFACAMTRRAVWQQLGGLNERDLSIAFNDIDYCLRAREAGYLVVYTPYATLYHHESKTRGYEDNPEKQARFFRETLYMQNRHRMTLERGDPYYNPNLRLDTHDFSAIPGYVDALPR